MSDFVRMFRCQRCGKWSHAKKKPTKHKRWVRQGDPLFDGSKVEEFDLAFDQDPGHTVDCGPFDTYRALMEARQ